MSNSSNSGTYFLVIVIAGILVDSTIFELTDTLLEITNTRCIRYKNYRPGIKFSGR